MKLNKATREWVVLGRLLSEIPTSLKADKNLSNIDLSLELLTTAV